MEVWQMKENRSFEVKERVTNTILKTVSAYANFGDGIIRFGITDDGKFGELRKSKVIKEK